jgi:hypothetical protein
MPLKRRTKYLIVSLVLSLGLILCVLMTVLFYLPHHIENRLLPEMAREAGFNPANIDIRRIGMLGADLGDFQLGPEVNPALSIHSVKIDYTPSILFRRHVRRIMLSGIEINCAYQNGQLTIPGFDLKKTIAKRNEKAKTPSSRLSIPLFVEKVIIKDAVIQFKWEGLNYRVPFEIELSPKQDEMAQLHCLFSVLLRDQKLLLTAFIDLTQKKISLDIKSDVLLLERFADLVAQAPGLRIGGEVLVTGQSELMLSPFKIESASIQCRFSKIDAAFGNVSIQNRLNDKSQRLPFIIEAVSGDLGQWNISTSALQMLTPVPVALAGIKTNIQSSSGQTSTRGHLSVDFVKTTRAQSSPIEIIDHLPVKAVFSGRYSRSGQWQFELMNSPKENHVSVDQDYRLEIGDLKIVTRKPEFKISGKGSASGGNTDITIRIPNLRLHNASRELRVPYIDFKGQTEFERSADDTLMGRIHFGLSGPDQFVKATPVQLRLPTVSFSGRFGQESDKDFGLNGTIKIDGGRIALSKFKFRAGQIQATLPVSWPPKPTHEAGDFSIAAFKWDKNNFGGIHGTLRQVEKGIIFKAKHRNRSIPGLTAVLSGNAGFQASGRFEGQADFKLTHQQGPEAIDLGKISPQAKGIKINGHLEADVKLILGAKGFQGSVNTSLEKGEVRMEDKGIAVEGIQIAMAMPDVSTLRSNPKQKVFFQKASVSDIRFTDGEVDFQIESAQSFFVEKARFKWCNGNVETHSLRISPGIEDYNLVLYCDRLNLAHILEQFGAARAVGDGNVNGRIPVRYHQGKISFDDAFLYSTPGNKGTIHLTGTEVLTAGIPKDTLQYTQIEVAREALKDYTYEWAKLGIVTEGEDLLLKLEFDGKPAAPLPFVYKKEIGGFVRVDAGSKGSRFQGIHLNVNFRLPLNKVIQYKELLKMIK